MLQWMEAEILVLDANDVGACVQALVEHGFDIEVLDDRIDPYSNAAWVRATVISELDGVVFFEWVETIVEPLNGHIEETGPVADPSDGLAGRVLN